MDLQLGASKHPICSKDRDLSKSDCHNMFVEVYHDTIKYDFRGCLENNYLSSWMKEWGILPAVNIEKPLTARHVTVCYVTKETRSN